MNDTNLKQSLREKAEKYGMDAPEGLWEDIERKVKGRIFIRRFARISAAAAAAALLVGLGIGLMREGPEVEPAIAEISAPETIESGMTSDDTALLLAEAVPEPEEQAPAAKASQQKVRQLAEVPVSEPAVTAEPTEESEAEEIAENETENGIDGKSDINGTGGASDTNGTATENNQASKPSVQPERSQLADNEYYRDAFREESQRRHSAEGLTVRLLAANSSSVSLGMGRMDADFAAAPANALRPANCLSADPSDDENIIYSADRIGNILIANLNEPTANETHHHQPVTFGVRIAYPLTDRLAVESGLNYSLLRSDFNYGGTLAYEEKKQTLHYLGIPLSLNYTLLHFRRLDFIVSAGVMGEKCVYGKVRTDYVMDGRKKGEGKTLSVKGLQWSSGVSASLQYNFVRNFGLFLEPGLRYRFENGKGGEVRSSYTENPLNFSLAFGARVNL